MPNIGIRTNLVHNGTRWNYRLVFNCEENQTIVGQITGTSATSFTILQGAETFTIDNYGNIAFIVAPDYEIQNLYTLKVLSNKYVTYNITVNVTDYSSETQLLNSTALLLTTIL